MSKPQMQLEQLIEAFPTIEISRPQWTYEEFVQKITTEPLARLSDNFIRVNIDNGNFYKYGQENGIPEIQPIIWNTSQLYLGREMPGRTEMIKDIFVGCIKAGNSYIVRHFIEDDDCTGTEVIVETGGYTGRWPEVLDGFPFVFFAQEEPESARIIATSIVNKLGIKHEYVMQIFEMACAENCAPVARAFLNAGITGVDPVDWYVPGTLCATSSGPDVLKLLFEFGADPNALQGQLLCEALRLAPCFLETFLKYGANPNTVTSYGETLLELAMDKRDPEYVEMLFQYGADPNALQGQLLCEALNLAPCFLETFLKYGANPNTVTSYGDTLLELAMCKRDPEYVEMLFRYNADPNAIDKDGNPLMLKLIKCGDVEHVRQFLAHGADMYAYDNHFLSTYYHAVKSRNRDIVHAFLDAGADQFMPVARPLPRDISAIISVPFNSGIARWICTNRFAKTREEAKAFYDEIVKSREYPMWYIAMETGPAVLKPFLDHGVTPDATVLIEEKPRTMWQMAMEMGHSDILELLCEYGLKPDARIASYAVRLGKLKNIEWLFSNGMSPNAVDEYGNPLALLPIKQNRSNILKTFLENGANPNATDKRGKSLWNYASESKKINLLAMLLKYGGNTADEGKKQECREMFKSIIKKGKGCERELRLLLECGVDFGVYDKKGYSWMFYAVNYDLVGVVELLLKNGMDPLVPDRCGGAPIFYTIVAGGNPNMEIVESFLRNGANPNLCFKSPNGEWRLPPLLALAVTSQNPALARMLLEYGANPEAEYLGGTIMDYAEKEGTSEMKAVFQTFAERKEFPKPTPAHTSDVPKSLCIIQKSKVKGPTKE